MSVLKPEVGDVWAVIKSPDVHNIIMDTSDCRGYIDFIHSYKKPDGKFVALCHTKECEYFLKHCKYLGKSKASIRDLFCVEENAENVVQTDLRNIDDMQKKIEFAKEAVDLFFKTEDESKLLEIAEWE